jgi:phage baseplate assembly protein W
MPEQPLGTDLRLVFSSDDPDKAVADLALGGDDVQTLSGVDNLAQALTLRLLVDTAEISGLGHPRYGSDLRDLIGEPLDRANLELMRRYVRQALLREPRVKDVLRVTVAPRPGAPGIVDLQASVLAVTDEEASVGVVLDVR